MQYIRGQTGIGCILVDIAMTINIRVKLEFELRHGAELIRQPNEFLHAKFFPKPPVSHAFPFHPLRGDFGMFGEYVQGLSLSF